MCNVDERCYFLYDSLLGLPVEGLYIMYMDLIVMLHTQKSEYKKHSLHINTYTDCPD